MHGLALAGAAVALVAGVSAVPANTKTTTTETTTITKIATETDLGVTTTTKYVTQTAKAATTLTVISDYVSTVTSTITSTSYVTVLAASTVTAPSTVTITKTAACSSTAGGSTSSAPASTPASSSSAGGSTTSAPSVTPTSTSSTSAGTSFTTTETAKQASSTKGLEDYAKAVGRYLGTAVDYPGTGEGSDPIYLAVATNSHEFGQYTPANIMKYEFTEPQQGVFDFSGADDFVNWTQTNNPGSLIRCHNLLWYQELPTWLTGGSWTNETLIPVMKKHIQSLIAHFGDACYCWDVVNEALSDSPTPGNPWRTTDIWYQVIGPAYVPLAFQYAAEAVAANNLKTKLYYNDYSIEWPGAKTNNAYALVQNLTNAGIQIDGVGLQSHFIIGETPGISTFAGVMAGFTNISSSIEVAITELDVRAQTLPVSDAQQIQQFNDFRTAVGGCVATPKCVGVTLWDFDDTYSWIPSTFKGQGWGTPWFLPPNGTALVKKIAYDGIIDGFDGSTAQ